MSLNYDLKKVHDYKALLVNVVDDEMGSQRYAVEGDDPEKVYEAVNFVTRDIIFLTMPLAMGEITEKAKLGKKIAKMYKQIGKVKAYVDRR